tara:strand:+ start:3765 stop:4547 length:783 start_codon:yes stop_codon:yes gene_type:complete
MALLVASCTNKKQENTATTQFLNKGHEVVYQMVKQVGTYEELWKRKDVVYTYTYQTPDGKTDISTEKYLFDGELSVGIYHQHERTLPHLEGEFKQGYDSENFWILHKGEYLDDEEAMKRVRFNRKTNFYWFAMFQKLLDPGVNYEYLREEIIDGQKYDVVKITFDSENDKQTDIYQLYVNKKTNLVDQFLFTVVDFGVVENPMLMKVEYEKIDGLMIPNKRIYKKSTWDAVVDDKPWIKVNWSDIKFSNGLTRETFLKQG